VLAGDTLFIGDVGRPDLMASFGVTAQELAAQLYDPLHHKLLRLPADTLAYPAHGAGSLCGKNLSTDTVSTVGVQRRYNDALQPMSKEEFIWIVTADQPEVPDYFTSDAILNRQERQTLDQTLEERQRSLALADVLCWQRKGAQAIEVRDAADFEGAHLAGAIDIGLGGSFATWAAIGPAELLPTRACSPRRGSAWDTHRS
jgi:hydroxyacylglutathione hydrolase